MSLLLGLFLSVIVHAQNCPPTVTVIPKNVEVRTKVIFSINIENADWEISGPQGHIEFSGPVLETLFTAPGVYTGVVGGANACEQVYKENFTFTVYPELKASSISINDGAKYTRDSDVQLRLRAEGATEMAISESASCDGDWQSYNTSENVELKNLNREASVFVKFRNPIKSSECINDSIVHDDIAPKISITAQPQGWNGASGTVTFTVSEDGSGVKQVYCSLDQAATQNCKSPMALSNLSAGTHALEIFAEDEAGNLGRKKTAEWKVDRTPPVINITQTPTDPSSELTQRFAFEGEDPETGVAGYECRIDDDVIENCESPLVLEDLFEGEHKFEVLATNGIGMQSTIATYVWTIAYPLPQIFLTQVPPAQTNLQDAEFKFEATSAVGIKRIECSLDGLAFAVCTSPLTTPVLPYGEHKFSVRALDNNSKYSEVASHEWEILKPIKNPVVEKIISAGPATTADVLLVLDNSTSMRSEFRDIPKNFTGFLDLLQGRDWQLAITSTDIYGGLPWEQGNFAEFADESRRKIFKPSIANVDKLFLDTLQIIEFGTGIEQGIAGIHKAIEHKKNQPFFRNNSALVVVIVSDEDEKSSGKNLKGKNLPENLVSFVQQKWSGAKPFVVHSVVWQPNSESCKNGAHKGRAYSRLTELTGGINGSICGRKYADELAGMMDKLPGNDLVHTLQCLPENGAVDVAITPAAPNTKVSVDGTRLTLSPTPNAGSSVTLTYFCATRLNRDLL